MYINLPRARDGAGAEKRRGDLGAQELGPNSPCAAGNSEDSEFKSEPGLPGVYDDLFVKAGGYSIFT